MSRLLLVTVLILSIAGCGDGRADGAPPPASGTDFATSSLPPEEGSARIVDLPALPRDPASPGMSAAAHGSLVRDGNCVYPDTAQGTRYVFVLSADATMKVTDDALLDVVVGGRSVEEFGVAREYSGGEISWGQLPVANLREECRTEKMWVS